MRRTNHDELSGHSHSNRQRDADISTGGLKTSSKRSTLAPALRVAFVVSCIIVLVMTAIVWLPGAIREVSAARELTTLGRRAACRT